MSLVVDHLTKRFGSVVALDDLVFEVPPGQVFELMKALESQLSMWEAETGQRPSSDS